MFSIFYNSLAKKSDRASAEFACNTVGECTIELHEAVVQRFDKTAGSGRMRSTEMTRSWHARLVFAYRI